MVAKHFQTITIYITTTKYCISFDTVYPSKVDRFSVIAKIAPFPEHVTNKNYSIGDGS
jgi:hypothetical protein